jgi:AcrR family transcriptional regulator
MLEEGYAAVTYRKVAAEAGVTAPLVQYYFPSIDSLFLAMLQEHAQPNLERLTEKLEGEENPIRAIWEYTADETTSALMIEFMALGNHKKEIRAEIGEVLRRSRKVELDALSRVKHPEIFGDQELPQPALLFLLSAIPHVMLMESAMDVTVGHAEILDAVERYLTRVEREKRSNSGRRSSEVKADKRPAGRRRSSP